MKTAAILSTNEYDEGLTIELICLLFVVVAWRSGSIVGLDQ